MYYIFLNKAQIKQNKAFLMGLSGGLSDDLSDGLSNRLSDGMSDGLAV